MQVLAFCTPANTSWRWRIVSYSGDVVEESHQVFPTIATAVAQGAKRLVEMNVVDRTVAAPGYRSTRHLRRRSHLPVELQIELAPHRAAFIE